MNHIYRTVFNRALGAMVAVAEIATMGGGQGAGSRSARRRLGQPPRVDDDINYFINDSKLSIFNRDLRPISLITLMAMAFPAQVAFAQALPQGGVAIHGTASNAYTANRLTVNTTNGAGSQHNAINWNSFSIGAGNTVQINQVNAASTSINRVVTNTPSTLFGSLQSNGKVVLVNQSGIAVGAGAFVDTAGFTASVVGMSSADAIAGRLRFAGSELGLHTGALRVDGNIVSRGGDVVLIAPNVEVAKTAVVEAQNGSVSLAAGQSVEITGRGLEGITMLVQAKGDQALNLGTLKGDAVGIFAGTLRHSGLVQAVTADSVGGKVVLRALGDAFVEGAGQIIAASGAMGAKGGQVDMLGERVSVRDSALIDVSGAGGGGRIRVGGGFQGKDSDVVNAQRTYFGANATLKADATVQGDGGTVIVWADEQTRGHGTISAQGGAAGGDGGFVEVSGKHRLAFDATVNTSAGNGRVGTLLLDPDNIIVAIGGSVPLTSVDQFADVGATFTLSPATINASATNVVLQANEDITITNAISMGTPGVGFTAQAGGYLLVNAGITTKGGVVSLTAGDPGSLTSPSEGALQVSAPIDTTGGGAFSSGANINLDAPISDVGGNSIHLAALLNAGSSGHVALTGQQVTQVSGGITAASLSANVTAGVINLGQANSISSDVTFAGINAVTFNNTFGGTINFSGVSSSLGTVTLTTAGGFSSDNVISSATAMSLTAGGNIALGDDVSAGGTLTINTSAANGSISNSSGAFTVSGGLASFSAGTGSINLASNFNNFSTISLSGAGSIHARDNNAMQVTSLTLNDGNVAVDLQAGGLLSLPATAINTGISTLHLLSGTSLTTAAALGGAVVQLQSNAGNVNLNHNITAGDTLSVAANGGGITQAGGSTVQLVNGGGISTFTATAGNITLGTVTNTFNGPLNMSSPGSITVQSGNPVYLGAVSAGTTLSVTTSSGAIQQTGAQITVGGLATFNAGSNDVLLGATSNLFNTVAVTAHHVTVVDANSLVVSNLTLSGVGNVYLEAGAGAGGTLSVPATPITTTAQVSLVSNSSSPLVTPSSITGSTILLANPNGNITLNDISASGPIFVTAGLDIVRNTGTLSSSAGIDLTAGGSIGSSGNLVQVDPGAGLVSLTSSFGDIYVQQASGLFDFQKYTVDAQGSTTDVVLKGSANPATLMLINSPLNSDDNVSFINPASGGGLYVSGLYSGHELRFGATGAGGFVEISASTALSASTTTEIFSLSGDVNVSFPFTAVAPTGVALIAGNSVTGSGTITTQGSPLNVIANSDLIPIWPFGSYVASGIGGIGLGAINTSGAAGVNGTSSVGATGQNGGDVSLVLRGTSSSGIGFTSITARGGAGATNTSTGAGQTGGSGGNVDINSTLADLQFASASIDTQGGRGGDATIAGSQGGNGGNGGYVLIAPGGDLNFSGVVLTKAGDGGNAVAGPTVASGGSGGTSGGIGLHATGLLVFDGITSLSAIGGLQGLSNTGAGGFYTSADISLQATEILQTGGATLSTVATTVHLLATTGSVNLPESGNLIGEVDGSAAENIHIDGVNGVGDGGLNAGSSFTLDLTGWLSDPLLIQGALNAGTINLAGFAIDIKDHITALNTLTLNSSDYILQDPAGGASTINVLALNITAGGDVELQNAANNLNQVTVSSAQNLAVTSNGSMALGDITATGLANFVSTNGNLFLEESQLTAQQLVFFAGQQVLAADAILTSTVSVINFAAGTGIDLTNTTLVSASDLDISTQNGPLLASGANIAGVSGHWRTYLDGYGTRPHQFGPFDPLVNADYRQVGGNFGTILGTGNGSLWTDTGGIGAGTFTGTATKVYDGTTAISLNGVGLSGLLFGETIVNLASLTGTLADPNAGTLKTVSFTGPTSLDGLVTSANGKPTYGYSLVGASGAVGTVNAAAITIASLNGTREYDGTMVVNAGIFGIQGLINGETLTLSGAGSIADKNVGVNKPVTLGSLALGNGTGLASNYTLSGGTHVATITQKASSTWSGGTGDWSDASKWDGGNAVPDFNNVRNAIIPSGSIVTFDADVGGTSVGRASVQNINNGGRLIISAGHLTVADTLQTYQYDQTGGHLDGGGKLVVDNAFSKTDGTIDMGGLVDITHANGNLVVGGMRAGNIALRASNGGISQNGALLTSGTLAAHAAQSIDLKGNSTYTNFLSNVALLADNGKVDLVNTGVVNVFGIGAPNGGIKVTNTGGINIYGPVRALNGDVEMVANSPLFLAADAEVVASGNVSLSATEKTSTGNMVLNGVVRSLGGNVNLTAANDLTQNGEVYAAGAISGSAGGLVTFGPLALSAGNPVRYVSARGVEPNPPASVAERFARNSGTSGLLADFVSRFQDALDAQDDDVTGGPLKKKKGDEVTVEGETCRP